jgi:hypothetical protein
VALITVLDLEFFYRPILEADSPSFFFLEDGVLRPESPVVSLPLATLAATDSLALVHYSWS